MSETIKISAENANVRRLGRTLMRNGTLWLGYSLTGAEFGFDGGLIGVAQISHSAIQHRSSSWNHGVIRAGLGPIGATLHGTITRLLFSPVVVAVARTIDLPPVEGTLPRSPADPDALAELAERHGIENSVRRLGAALGWQLS